jgi:TrmH RNA methyltransferase
MKARDDKPRRFGPKRSNTGRPDFKKSGFDRSGFKRSGFKRSDARRAPDRDDFAHRRDLARVAGANAVRALFTRAPERVERLFFARGAKESVTGYCRVLAKARKIFREVPEEELARIAGTPMHGGIVAVARPKPLGAFDPDEAARRAAAAPLLPILHGIGNPHNLGAIARTAAFFGLPRMVLTDHPAQAGLSDAALRVAEGGFEALDVFRATDLAGTLARLKAGYRVLGAAPGRAGESPRAPNIAPLPGRGVSPERIARDRPIALVFGNEETGLDAATLAACDEAVAIPGANSIEGGGGVQSLNVSVAAGILLFAFNPAAKSR